MKTSNWFQNNTTQRVFMQVAQFPAVIKSGPVQAIGEIKKVVKDEIKFFRVGRDKVGGSQIVGGPK